MNLKKIILLNLPYVVIGLLATNLGEAWRLAEGVNASEKAMNLMNSLGVAFQSPLPSFLPLDLHRACCRCAAAHCCSYQEPERQEVPQRHGVRLCSVGYGTGYSAFRRSCF